MTDESASSAAASTIDATAAQVVPVPQDVIDQHRQARSAAGLNPLKDLVPDQEEPSMMFDIKSIEAAIEAGTLPTQQGIWPTHYAKMAWKIEYSNNTISQGYGSFLDLIWVATMPPHRQAEPVLVIQYQAGCSLLDGSHRLARALMDGKKGHPSIVFDRDVALPHRKPASDS